MYVNKSKGRQHYEYSLVGTPGVFLDRYQEFSRELAALEQTDEPVEAKQRREQPILRRWLFEGKTTERCAICGEEHMVSALRAAHKKKRSQCIESERRDPYVVMPVCIFGCDFLYEARHIVVEDGVVQAGSTGDFGEADRRYLQKVIGKDALTAPGCVGRQHISTTSKPICVDRCYRYRSPDPADAPRAVTAGHAVALFPAALGIRFYGWGGRFWTERRAMPTRPLWPR